MFFLNSLAKFLSIPKIQAVSLKGRLENLYRGNGVDNLIPLCNKHHKMIEDLTFKFTRLFDDNNYDKAKYYLNLILREQQLQTFCVLKEIKNKNDS